MFRQSNCEGVYEGEVFYENNQARMSRGGPPAISPRNDQKRQQEDVKTHVVKLKTQINDVIGFMRKTKKQNTIGFAIFQTVILLLLVTLVVLLCNIEITTTSANESVAEQSGTDDKRQHAKSCYDLKQKELYTNGIYSIEPEDDFQQIAAFCDMETDGGGWTLVASIHENDIGKKCDAEDRWSKYVPISRVAVEEKTNWENKLVFGDVHRCTQNDYKNSAYYAIHAKDVMIWHVPTQTPTTTMKSRAKLRYRTTNHFLQKTGGNLKSLFDERYPLKVKPEKFIGATRNDMIMSALSKRTWSIRAILPDWYTYDYGTEYTNRIKDNTLYSNGGNQITFGTSLNSLSLSYMQRHRFTRPNFLVDTMKSQPFLLVAAISNKKETTQYFYIQIRDYRKRSDSVDILRNTITQNYITLQYRAIQFSNPDDPTVCEFHFITYSTKKWRSTPPKSFEHSYNQNSGTSRNNQFRADGTPTNIVMGYMLLTRSNGTTVSKKQADDIADIILRAISTVSDLFNEDEGGGLVVPVTFDKGSSSAILETIPPNIKLFVEPGYLQFRAYNDTGYPNAMCPGIKMNTNAPEYSCIGGISDDLRDYGTCGDFAGWAGAKADVIQQNKPNGLAHSQNDISSVILIFYR